MAANSKGGKNSWRTQYSISEKAANVSMLRPLLRSAPLVIITPFPGWNKTH